MRGFGGGDRTSTNALRPADDEDVFFFEIQCIIFLFAALDVSVLGVEPIRYHFVTEGGWDLGLFGNLMRMSIRNHTVIRI